MTRITTPSFSLLSHLYHRDYVTGIGNSSRDPYATRTKCFFADDSFAGNAAQTCHERSTDEFILLCGGLAHEFILLASQGGFIEFL